jgi:hypothetical protein
MKLDAEDESVLERERLYTRFVAGQTRRVRWEFGNVVVVVHERVEPFGEGTEQWVRPCGFCLFDRRDGDLPFGEGFDCPPEQVGEELVTETDAEYGRPEPNGSTEVVGQGREPRLRVADPRGRASDDYQIEVDVIGNLASVRFESDRRRRRAIVPTKYSLNLAWIVAIGRRGEKGDRWYLVRPVVGLTFVQIIPLKWVY